MSSEITTSFVKQFGANVFHLSQQKGSRLRGCVRVESIKGDSRFFDRIGKAAASLKTSRHEDTPINDTPHSRRMCTLASYHYGDMVDDQDKVRSLNDPTNDYSVAAQWALGRSMDSVIIAAALGSAYGGVSGSSAVVLPSTQKLTSVASAAGAALNVQALRRASKILNANDVDESEMRYFALNAYQLESLLSQTETTSSDFNTVKALVSGQLTSFMGFEFKRLELLTDRSGALQFDTSTGAVGSGGGDADGYDQCIAWAKNGIVLGLGADIQAEIAKDPSKSFGTRIYAKMDIGSTRMEEEKVVEVLCKDT